jgi:hypothetical protein
MCKGHVLPALQFYTSFLTTLGTGFFYATKEALGHSETNAYTPYISGNYVEFWVLATAIHVLYIHRSPNNVLGIKGVFHTIVNINCTFDERKKERKNKKKRKRKKKEGKRKKNERKRKDKERNL